METQQSGSFEPSNQQARPQQDNSFKNYKDNDMKQIANKIDNNYNNHPRPRAQSSSHELFPQSNSLKFTFPKISKIKWERMESILDENYLEMTGKKIDAKHPVKKHIKGLGLGYGVYYFKIEVQGMSWTLQKTASDIEDL